MVNFTGSVSDGLLSATIEQVKLYQRIQAFCLDQPEDQLSFSKRLARDNHWSLDYTHRVIEEYKKFTFLAVVAGHPVTPSDQVDQVWHLHLSYTHSYWQEFCPQILQTPLHHNPTRGGSSEQIKFDHWYNSTLASYQQFFGQQPPRDIWPDAKDRFERDLHFVRVNTQQHWLVPKPDWSGLLHKQYKQCKPVHLLPLLFTLAVAVTGCQDVSNQAIAGIPNPLNFRGPEFLAFYVSLSLLTILLAAFLRNILRLPGERGKQLSIPLEPYEAAYLAKGGSHVVDTAIASLVQKGYVTVQRRLHTLTLYQSTTNVSSPIEQAVVNAIRSNGQINSIRNISIPAIDGIRERLYQLQLLVNPDQAAKAQAYPTLLIACLLGLGIAKIFVGISRGRPVGFLVMICMVLFVIAIIFWKMPVNRSRYGDRVLQSLQKVVRLTFVGPTNPQLMLSFALLGASVLPNRIFADLKQAFSYGSGSSGSGGGGGSSDGGGGGSGDGGGGGCGGCGGCGG